VKESIREVRRKAVKQFTDMGLSPQWLKWNVQQLQKLHDEKVALGGKMYENKVRELAG